MVLTDQHLRLRSVHRDGIADVLGPDARIARHRPAERDEIVQQGTGILRHVEYAELRIEHVHLGRRLGLRRQLEDDLNAVDRVRLDGLGDRLRRRDEAGRPTRHALAKAGIDLSPRPARQHRAELELGAARHRRSRQHVLAGDRLHEAGRRYHLDLARLHVGFVDHAPDAAVVVDVAVGVDHRDHGLSWPVRVVEFERRPRDLCRGQRIDQDETAVALDHRQVGDVEAAQLVETLRDLEQAVREVEPRHAPQAGIDGAGCQLAVDESVLAEVPEDRAAACAHEPFGHGCDETALRGLEVCSVGEGQLCRHRRICGPGCGFGVARGVEMGGRNRNCRR